MKNYQLEYDKCFIALPQNGKSLVVNGEPIMDISIFFCYHVYDKKTGEEVFFTCDENEDPSEQYLDGYSLNAFFCCNYDRDNGYVMIPTEIHKQSKYRVEYTIGSESCFKGVVRNEFMGFPMAVSEPITYQDFIRLLKEYPEYFDNSTNQNAQSGAYGCCTVSEK